MTAAELREEWRRVMAEEPRSYNRAWLWRRLAWAVQAKEFGGLSTLAKQRLESLSVHAEAWMPLGKRAFAGSAATTESKSPRARPPRPGTILSRRYKGRTIAVTVREDGFEFAGRMYASLTAITEAITGGSHQSGRRFFGLTGPEFRR
jgi:hypothetical protein